MFVIARCHFTGLRRLCAGELADGALAWRLPGLGATARALCASVPALSL